MEENKIENPLAFPLPETNQNHQPGMTLRDYFAVKAMHATMSDPNYLHMWNVDQLVKDSYFIADTMLKERLK